MGHEGMRASLVSREVITDSVETVIHAERFDAFVGLAGCDKSIPGMLMAAARLNLPSVFVYNGSTVPGVHAGKTLTSLLCSKQSVPLVLAQCPKQNLVISSVLHVREKVRVAECLRPTQCHQSPKHWE